MRIATWNVERPRSAHSRRSRRVLDQIRAIDADIWILTETHDAITPGGAYYCSATEPVSDPPTRHSAGERRTIVWSRWPIKERIDADMAHRTTCVNLETPLGELITFGTIIPYSGRDCPPYGTLRRWDAHYAAIAIQGAAWQRLRRSYSSCGLCVAGDFNQTRESPHKYGTKWGRNLLDLALKAAGLHCATIPGFAAKQQVDCSGWELPGGVQPIDHICLDSAWIQRVTAVGSWPGETADGGYLSDHSGVWIQLD